MGCCILAAYLGVVVIIVMSIANVLKHTIGCDNYSGIGVVGSHTLSETQGYIYVSLVNTGVLNESETREVTCGYDCEHEL